MPIPMLQLHHARTVLGAILCAGSLVTPIALRDAGAMQDERAHALDVEGTVVEHAGFVSEVLGDTLELHVYLPPSYGALSSRRYPVLYALDGQNLFDDALAAGGEEWTLDEILELEPAGIPELLVVGVIAGANAVRDLTPPGSAPGARGDLYLDFLTEELMPFIDEGYRTRGDAMIMGHARSAVLAIYASWRRPDLFEAALALDVPDVDATTTAWTETRPEGGRPWIWLEQSAAEKARPSTTELLANLQQHADVRFIVSGAQASRSARIVAALRAAPLR
jgi:enterochelin esterase-like enzyme